MQIPAGKKYISFRIFTWVCPTVKQAWCVKEKSWNSWSEIKNDAADIFIVGDLFDFWYEYKKVVPKGFVRILGKMAEITDSGIPIHFFVGNHDMWMSGYFENELNIPVYHDPRTLNSIAEGFISAMATDWVRAITATSSSRKYFGISSARSCSACYRLISEWASLIISVAQAGRQPVVRREIPGRRE